MSARTRPSLLVALLGLTAAACFTEESGISSSAAGDSESEPGGSESGDGDETAGTGQDTSEMPSGAAPQVSVSVDRASLTEGESVTFDIVAKGSAQLMGGTLNSADQSVEFGPLTALSTEAYTFTLSWEDLNAARPIEFDNPEPAAFRIEIVDADGEVGFAGVEVMLTCGDVQACDGQCIDKTSSNDHCGACGRACITHDHALETLVGACRQSECTPTFSECWSPGEFTSCADYCQSQGQTCAQGGSPDLPETGCAGYTLRIYEAASGHSCVDTPDFGFASWAACTAAIDLPATDEVRCCCTQ